MTYIPVEQRTGTKKGGYVPVAQRTSQPPQPTPSFQERMPFTMGGALRTQVPQAPSSATVAFAKEIPQAATSAWSKWTEDEKKRRAEQTIGQQAYTELVKRPAKILATGAGMIAGGVSDIGKTFMELGGTYARAALTDETIGEANLKMQEYLKGDKARQELEEKIFGFKSQSYGDWQEGISKYLEDANALPGEKKILPFLLPLLALSADLTPGGKPATIMVRKSMEEIAKETGEVAIRKMLRDLAIPDDVAERALPRLIGANNVNKVKLVLREELEPVTKSLTRELATEIGRGADEALPTVARTADEALPTVARTADEALPTVTRTADDVAPTTTKALDDATQQLARTSDDLARTASEMKKAGKTFEEFVKKFPESGVYKDTPETKKIFEDVGKVDAGKYSQFEDYLDELLVKFPDAKLPRGEIDWNKTDIPNDVLETARFDDGISAEEVFFEMRRRGDTKVTSMAKEALTRSQLQNTWNNAPTTTTQRGTTALSEPTPRAPQPQAPTPTRTVPSESAGIAPQQARRTGNDATATATDQATQATQKSDSYNVTIKDGDKEVKLNIGIPEEKVKMPQEERDDIASLVWKDNISISTSRANGQMIPERNLAKEIEANIIKHSNKIPDEEVAKVRNELLLNEETVADILARKRGVVTDAESIRRAAESKATMEQVLNLRKGSALNGEQVDAVKQIVQNAREEFTGLLKLLDGGGIAQTKEERALLKRLGLEDASEMRLINEAMTEKQIEIRKAEAVLYAVGSEAGRALRSYGKFVDGIELRMRTVLSKLKGLSEDERAAIIETISRLDLNDNKVFLNTLEQFNKADWADKIAEYMVAVKLWNPTTHVVNVGGNFVRQGADLAIKTVTDPTVAVADWTGAAVGIRQGVRNAVRAMTNEGYARNLSKYIEAGGDSPAIKGMKGRVIRYPFQLLAAGDELFRAIAYNRAMYRQTFIAARKEGLKGADLNARMKQMLESPSYEHMARASDEAKRMTFQEDMGEIMSMVNKLRTPSSMKSWYGKLAAIAVRAFLPFLKTPTNLFKQSLDFSPVGLLKNSKELRKAVKNGDREKVGTIIGEAVLGTALMYVIYEQYHQGNVTGGAPKKDSEKDAFYREKKLPYAIKIGDTWVQYKRVDPFATTLGLVADVETLRESGEDVGIGSVAHLLSRQLSDKTYLQGVNDFMNMIGLGESWEAEYAWKSALLGGAFPSIVGHAARSIDPTVRDVKTLGERTQALIPGMSDELPAKVNVLGYDIQRANKGLNYFFNPIQTDTAYIEPVTRELMKINHTIATPSTSFSRDGVKYKLTDEEYERYARTVGKQLRNELAELFKSGRYERAKVEEKEKMIDKIRDDIQSEYKDEYIKGKTSATRSSSGNIFKGAF